jgi:hypothetical protein
MGGTGISRSRVSRLCEDIDERVQAFLSQRVTGPVSGSTPPTRDRGKAAGSSVSP